MWTLVIKYREDKNSKISKMEIKKSFMSQDFSKRQLVRGS